ncbi:efflux RND transporter permease subunit [Candidatus Neomarinimicrobiota bacterium]
MILSKIAIKRGITVTMAYLIAIGFGLFGLSSLKLDLYPNITFPVIAVMSQYEGVGPEDIEEVLTRPLEQAVTAVENVKKITSNSGAGTSVIILEFAWGSDMEKAENDVRTNIDFVRDYLPEGSTDPITFAFNPAMQPIVYLAATSDQLGMAELRRLIDEQVSPLLERLPGVASTDIQGGLERQIKVLVDPHALAAQGFSLQQIVQILRMENLQIPGGIIDESAKEFSVKTYGQYANIDQIKNTVIGQKNGIPIYLKNVAQVVDGYKEQRMVLRNNGKSALMLYVMKQTDANTVRVAEVIQEELPKIAAKVGNGLEFETVIDFADFINDSINNLSTTIIQASFLAFLVLLFFLRNVRSSIIVAISIPVSIIMTFFVMSQFGITLNIISMAGLALAVGMLVDNAIVVLENIFRFKEDGVPIKQAADEGTSQVSNAIIAATLTTLAVFVPILFVPGIAGIMFNDMAITIVFSLSVSLLVALTLIPLLASRWIRPGKTEIKNKYLNKISDSIGSFLHKTEQLYLKSLDFFMKRRKTMLISITGLFIITIMFSSKVGGDFLGNADQGFITINVERESGAGLITTNETFLAVEKLIEDKIPEAENVYLAFGTGDVWSTIFGNAGSNKGQVMITLSDINDRKRSQFEIEDSLRQYFDFIPGAVVSYQDNSGMPGMSAGGDISIKIFGYDRTIASAVGNQIADAMDQVESVVDIKKSYAKPSPEYQVYLDRDRISAMGLSVTQVAMAIESSIKGTIATVYREGGKEIDVLVQLDEDYRNSMTDLENIFITSPMGSQIPLSNLANIVPGESATTIIREDQERMVSVSCKVSGSDLRTTRQAVEEKIGGLSLPQEFRWEIGGTAEDQMESFGYLGLALIAAVLLVYMVMASLFESLLNPFIIIFTIPLAFIGVIWGLILTGTTLTITALIGGMLLVGIVVNNGIVLIDYINQLREKHGYELWKAVMVGGKRRMRPILLTALTTIFSMMPLALELGSGAEIWSPMARAVIGGLTASTFFTLIIIPVLYFIIERMILKRKMKKGLIKEVPIRRPENITVLTLD